MISLSTILEATFSAISKETGKKVYFKSKPSRDAAIKAGTHNLEKKKTTTKKVVGKPVFPSVKLPSVRRKEVSSRKIKHSDFFDFSHHFGLNWSLKKGDKVKKISKKTIKEQKQALIDIFSEKGDKYAVNVLSNFNAWQNGHERWALPEIDKFMKANPIPPIQTDEYVLRGMSLSAKQYKKILSDFSNPKTIKFPIGSFSMDANVALKFAEDTDFYEKEYSIIFRVKSQCNKLKGYLLNTNISITKNGKRVFGQYEDEQEILLPSNQKYVVEKTFNYTFGDRTLSDVKKLTVIDLVQKCSANEGEENDVLDLTDDKFYQIVMTYKPKK